MLGSRSVCPPPTFRGAGRRTVSAPLRAGRGHTLCFALGASKGTGVLYDRWVPKYFQDFRMVWMSRSFMLLWGWVFVIAPPFHLPWNPSAKTVRTNFRDVVPPSVVLRR